MSNRHRPSPRTTLGAVAEINPEILDSSTPFDHWFRYIDLGSVTRGAVNWTSISDMKYGSAPSRARRVTQADDVLFGTVRPTLESHTSIPHDAQPGEYVASTGFAVLRARPPKTTGRFLYHYCFSHTVRTEARRAEVGSNYPAVSESDLTCFRFPDIPIAQQHRIAEILDVLDSQIHRTERLISKLRLARQGLLIDLLTQGINGAAQFRETAFGRVPIKWKAGTLGEFLVRTEYGISTPLSTLGRTPVLRMNNLNDGVVDLAELKYSDSREVLALTLSSGDVLFNRTNSLEHVGKAGIWRGQPHLVSFASYLVRLVPDRRLLTNEYLNRIMNLPQTQISLRLWATPGVHQVNVNPTNLKKIPVALPDTLAEQQQICLILDAQDDHIKQSQQELRKLALLKQALMSDLLTGRVRVPAEAIK